MRFISWLGGAFRPVVNTMVPLPPFINREIDSIKVLEEMDEKRLRLYPIYLKFYLWLPQTPRLALSLVLTMDRESLVDSVGLLLGLPRSPGLKSHIDIDSRPATRSEWRSPTLPL
ncbi:hypothetical protein CspHIS471_0105430 [Cutaneotrichosporon sp. HIS471]|nr:hypothetical protein CspHIS471_0105430 [Cutaneotrichosporon sp. HIS471]